MQIYIPPSTPYPYPFHHNSLTHHLKSSDTCPKLYHCTHLHHHRPNPSSFLQLSDSPSPTSNTTQSLIHLHPIPSPPCTSFILTLTSPTPTSNSLLLSKHLWKVQTLGAGQWMFLGLHKGLGKVSVLYKVLR